MSEVIVPDTSVIIDGRITKLVRKRKYAGARVLVPEVAVAELEAQANRGRESGFKGLDELVQLRKYAERNLIQLEFAGRRTKVSEFKDNDEMIRNTAKEYSATLVTSDSIQARIARSKGISVLYLPHRRVERKLRIFEFFDEATMSVHLKDRVAPMAKRGKPGEIQLVKLSDKPLAESELAEIAKEILEFARVDPDSFVEIERKGATVVQLQQLRIAIAKPPFSDGYEITAVRPIAHVKLEDYALSSQLMDRLRSRAEGIFVAGPPGAGKSTFSQALAEFYKAQGRIVKTMESPRDLVVSDEITQYAPLEGEMEKTADILLLVRPDYTVYDEVRKTRDFQIFADMRMAGVGMVGVVHATKAIDAIQRMIGRVELGIIPQIVDTVIFIKDGAIQKVYRLSFTVKVPSGMVEADLARPVIEVQDFQTGEAEYEIYTFGEETIVMPVSEERGATKPLEKLATERIAQEIKKFAPRAFVEVEVQDSKAVVWVDEKFVPQLIGRQGKNIASIEKTLGISIDVRSFEEKEAKPKKEERYEINIEETENYLLLKFGAQLAGKMVKVYADGKFLFTATIGRKGEIKVAKKSQMGDALLSTVEAQGEIYAAQAEFE